MAVSFAACMFGCQKETDPIGIFKRVSDGDTEATVIRTLGIPKTAIRSSDGRMHAIVYTDGDREGWVIFQGGEMKSRGSAAAGTLVQKDLDDFQMNLRQASEPKNPPP
jgi:hypothetical protein